MAAANKKVFELLDAIRGFAAIAVVQRHVTLRLMDHSNGTFLAVDLFFVLSGFVISHAYEARLASNLRFGGFMVLRAIRLYPLYLLGLGLAVAEMVIAGKAPPDSSSLAVAVGLALLYLPAFGHAPILGPRWSLTFELAVNALHAMLIRLEFRRYGPLLAGTGVLLLLALLAAGDKFDSGALDQEFGVGAARTLCSYFAGVVVYRHYRGDLSVRAGLGWGAAVLLANLGAVILLPRIVAAEFVMATAGFPLIVGIACRIDLKGIVLRIARLFGQTSYAIYVLHEPLGALLAMALIRIGIDPAASKGLGWAFIAVLLAVTLTLDIWFDAPVRAWLRDQYRKFEQRGQV